MTDPTLHVRDLDETELLARIFPLLPSGEGVDVGPGDDAAVVRAPDGRFVVTTDVLVEGRHFRRVWSSGYDVGVRAAVQNLADVAAMGARPTSMVVSLVAPGDLEVDWVTGFARGLAEAAGPAAVVGGDLSGGDVVMVAVTVHGDLEGRAPVLRSGARPGDVVAHAGSLGTSAAGLALLDGGVASAAHGEPGAGGPLAPFVGAYLRPSAPLAAGPAAARAGATAMLDVSDGLLRDAGRVARASGVTLDLSTGALRPDVTALMPAAVELAVADVGGGVDGARLTESWVLSGGEDHGLLATFPAELAARGLPYPFRPIGDVVACGDGEPAVLLDGAVPDVAPGWDHFRA